MKYSLLHFYVSSERALRRISGVKCNNNARRAFTRASAATCNSRALFVHLFAYLFKRIWASGEPACCELRAARFPPRTSESTGATADMQLARCNLKFIFRMNPEWSRCIEHFRRAEVCALRNFGKATYAYPARSPCRIYALLQISQITAARAFARSSAQIYEH